MNFSSKESSTTNDTKSTKGCKAMKEIQNVSTVRFKIEEGKRSTAPSMCCLPKPVLLFFIICAVSLTLIDSWMFKLLFNIPDLRDEIDDFSQGVDSLEVAASNLSDENEILNNSIKRLKKQMDDFRDKNTELKTNNILLYSNVTKLSAANDIMEDSVGELQDQINFLETIKNDLTLQNDVHKNHNSNLKVVVGNINNNVTELKSLEGEFNDTIQELVEGNRNLLLLLNNLTNLQTTLEKRVYNLNEQVGTLKENNDKAERLNKDLEIINRYQPEMNNEVPHSYKEYMRFVDESIQSRLNFLMDRKMESYLKLLKYSKNQIILEFDDLSSSAIRRSSPIVINDFEKIIGYIDTILFRETCADIIDFQLFLKSNVLEKTEDLLSISFEILMEAISNYFSILLNYYFPDSGEKKGLTQKEWQLAEFSCSLLEDARKFSFRDDSMVQQNLFNASACVFASHDICI